MSEGSGDDDALPDREALLGRRRRRTPQLLFLLESWSDLGEDDVFSLLGSTEAFADLSLERLRDLLVLLEPRHLLAGDVVFDQGEEANGLFVVAYGRLRVDRRDEGRIQVLGEVGPGATVGESELITGLPRATAARAVRDSLVLRLSPDGLAQVTRWHPELPLRLASHLLRRAGAAPLPRPEAAVQAVRTLAIVPAGEAALPERFVEQLVAALEVLGRATVVSSESIERSLGTGLAETAPQDPRNGHLVEWLQRVEQAPGVVVYVADAAPTNWTRRCLRHADRVLLVAQAGGSSRLGPVEQSLLGSEASPSEPRRELVLLHRQGTAEPSGTTAWLQRRAVAAHHHVAEGVAAHHRRLARLVTGRGLGVVFGGGGARGSAHLGVVRALEEAGVPIDAVGGASIGSVAAFMFAMGWDHGERMDRLPRFFSTRLIIQPTLPLVSLSSGRRLQRRILEDTGRRSIEDLWIRFFSISTNLTQATQVVHDRGDLALALRASVSLPGVLPPVQSGTDLLVDGGLLNNLPIDVMQASLGGGRVVAVDLRREVELKVQARLAPALSGWEVLARRIRKGAQRFDPPSVAAILQRSVELAGLLNERTLFARPGLDLYLCPPVARFGTFDFAASPLLVEEAYRYAQEQLTDAVVANLLEPVPAPTSPG